MAVVTAGRVEKSGIPLGGIGTGSVELRPNGEFCEWQIANNGEWKEDSRDKEAVEDNSIMDGSGLNFFVRTKQEGETKVRKLGLSIQERELRSCMFSWLKPVEKIRFDGRGPRAELQYVDETLPVTVEAMAMSPMIAQDENASGVPGFYMTFKVHNHSGSPVALSLLGKLQNPICKDEKNRLLNNQVIENQDGTRIMLTTSRQDASWDQGSMCFSAAGGTITYISGDYRSYMDSYISSTAAFGVSEESMLFPFRSCGELPNSNVSRAIGNSIWMPDSELEALEESQLAALLQEYGQYAFAQSLAARITQVDKGFFDSKQGMVSFLQLLRDSAGQFEGKAHGSANWGDCALNASFVLAPEETREVRFTVSWFFPNHYSVNGYRLGHWYENHFTDALAVSRYLEENYDRYDHATKTFTDCMVDTSLCGEIADSWLIHLTTLIKSSWWIKDGRFGIWEGIGSCGFHTTDITYQGSFGLVALYPELQKRQMNMGAQFQNGEGRVHHFFTPDLSSVDNGFERVDMNSQFVLLVCRDYLWTGDREYLTALYPNVKAAIASLLLLDTDGDGLLDTGTGNNTYDAWNFFGTPSYINSLWLSCLRAGAVLAEEMEDAEAAGRYRELLERGRQSMVQVLWNGRYFDLWADGGKKDSCCMSDQLDGEWYVRLLGLEGVLEEEHILKALDHILAYNYSEENGLINASYPSGTKPTIYTYRNCQAEANWTGIEYAFASFLYLMGRDEMAEVIVKNVDMRYRRAGRIWNHMECGDHYYRAMSSWSTLLAATGLSINSGRGQLVICPACVQTVLRAPWVMPGGFGTMTKDSQSLSLACVTGELRIKTLICNLPASEVCVTVQPVREPQKAERRGFVSKFENGRVTVLFDSEVIIKEGNKLTVTSVK